MKPNELRINNYVFFKHCDYDKTVVRTVNYTQYPNLLGLKGISVNHIEYNHIEPIQLTDKWLIDFGFEKTEWDNNNSFRKMIGNNDYTIVFYSNGICEIGDIIVKEMQYVHELQNLYFALTNEELKIK